MLEANHNNEEQDILKKIEEAKAILKKSAKTVPFALQSLRDHLSNMGSKYPNSLDTHTFEVKPYPLKKSGFLEMYKDEEEKTHSRFGCFTTGL